jgi:topoisomerase-4 subunit A
VAELVFTKERGKERKDNLVIDLENFISLKGIGALGNQLTKYKVLEINPLDPLPFELPEVTPAAAIEVVDQQAVNAVDLVETSVTSQEDVSKDESSSEDKEPPIGDDGQALLF